MVKVGVMERFNAACRPMTYRPATGIDCRTGHGCVRRARRHDPSGPGFVTRLLQSLRGL